MASSIDATKPTAGAALTADVRNNFSAAKTEIEALQAADATLAPKGAVTSSGLTMSTARLLGRTTAATGAVEEIAPGTNLTLAAGVLNAAQNGITTAGQMVLQSNDATGTAFKVYTPNVQASHILFQSSDRSVQITPNARAMQVDGRWESNSNFDGGNTVPSLAFHATNVNATLTFFSLGGRYLESGVMVLGGAAFANTGAALELIERTAPSAPPGSGVRLYAEASGKVVAKFSSGATCVIGNSKGTLLPAVYTVGTLPSALTSGNGARAHVSDALAPTFGATVAGGGSESTPVYSDGTNWKVG